MPADAAHAARYRESRALLDGPPPLVEASVPWAATVAFYAAVHLVERLAAAEGVHHTRHSGAASRAKYLATHPVHVAIESHLAALLAASYLARYDPPEAFAAAFPGDTTRDVLVGVRLAAIEAHVLRHLGSL